MKMGQRLHRRGQSRAGQGLAAQDWAGMRQSWGRNHKGWSRVWVHWGDGAGTAVRTKSCHPRGVRNRDCERARGPPRSGERKKQFEKEVERKGI